MFDSLNGSLFEESEREENEDRRRERWKETEKERERWKGKRETRFQERKISFQVVKLGRGRKEGKDRSLAIIPDLIAEKLYE